jgi:DNA-binding FadR family transcriptional regulator
VAAMRRGPAGGLVVREPDAGPATNAMVVYLEFVGTTVEHVLAARSLIEPLAAAQAAEHITEAGIDRLRELLTVEQRQTTGMELVLLRNQLHLAIAGLSDNPALALFVDVLLRLTSRYAQETMTTVPDFAHPALVAGHEAHDGLVGAVVSGEAGNAEQRAMLHVDAVAEFVLKHRVEQDRHNPGGSIWNTAMAGHTHDQKLAEVVARRIINEVSDAGWQVGSVIGSETSLLERFEVSRAVLREAVRLLEYHSVARMRRGPGGGLVVARPDPSASIVAMELYLDYQHTRVEHLRALRDRVEIGCLDYVAARADDPEVAHRLRVAGARRPHELAEQRAHPLHTEIAELSGNPVLALFHRILTTLWARRAPGPPVTPVPVRPGGPSVTIPPTDDEVEQLHQGLVEALVAGDASLARHRMRRHMETCSDWWQ